MSKLEPLVAAPHSPDNRKTAHECSSTKIDRVYIGCVLLAAYGPRYPNSPPLLWMLQGFPKQGYAPALLIMPIMVAAVLTAPPCRCG